MEFPQLVPSSRSFSYGDYPVKKYNAMDGFETRILLGSSRFNFELSLEYANIRDLEVVKFLEHYEGVTGTFQTFYIGPNGEASPTAAPKLGTANELGGKIPGYGKWRYKQPPQVTSVHPNTSTVRIVLLAVLI